MHIRLLAMAVLLGWSQAGFSDHGREHIIPLFVPNDAPSTGAAGQQQGFLRIINHSNKEGMVRITGFDDSGMMAGPVMLSMAALETVHINSTDVEDGNDEKNLSGGLGDGQGDWRLVLASEELDIEPLAYVRTKGDGMLIGMNAVASEAGMNHIVPMFNPAANPNQLSSLRIVNVSDTRATVTITGTDDMGEASAGSVTVNLPRRSAETKTAIELEEEGLGDLTGKWSLMVSANQPVQVLSLMNTPSGHLSNLSGGRRDYRGAAGLYNVTFDDDMAGIVVLLPDSRLYAWLPETGQNRIARGTYSSSGGMVEGSGVVYESGLIELDIATQIPSGGTDDVTLTAMYRSGDWISGEYTVAGEPSRAFSGYAFTGYERGGATESIEGTWNPTLGDESDLPATFTVMDDGSFTGMLKVDSPLGELDCGFTATLDAVNPAFSSFYGQPTIDCQLLAFGGEGNEDEVEMFMSVMDESGMPGSGNRAIVFSILPRDANEIGLGGLYELQ